VVPYDTTWARVHELLTLSAGLHQQSRVIRAEAERTHSRLEALYRHAEYLVLQGHQEANAPEEARYPSLVSP
jgi:hypothetical protein